MLIKKIETIRKIHRLKESKYHSSKYEIREEYRFIGFSYITLIGEYVSESYTLCPIKHNRK